MKSLKTVISSALFILLLLFTAACGGETATTTTPVAAPTNTTAVQPTTTTAVQPTNTTAAAPTSTTAVQPTNTMAPVPTGTTAAAAGTGDLTVVDGSGTTITLAKRPERFVCITEICTDILYELGLEPVAIRDTLAARPEYFGDRAKSFAVIGGSFYEPNLEDIANAKPDLVIGLAGVHEPLRDGLKTVAPLFIANPTDYNSSVEYLRTMGRLTGRNAEAEAAATRFLDKLAAYKAKSPKDKTALVMWGSDVNFGVDTTASIVGGMMAELTDYPWVPSAETIAAKEEPALAYNLEKLLDVDPDVIFAQTISFGPVASQPLPEQMAANPLWGELKAVKNNAVHEVDFGIWSTARGTHAFGLILDEAMPLIYPQVFPQPLP